MSEREHSATIEQMRWGAWYITASCKEDGAFGMDVWSGFAWGSERHAKSKAQRVMRRHLREHDRRTITLGGAA
jgi:hypothetical protein